MVRRRDNSKKVLARTLNFSKIAFTAHIALIFLFFSTLSRRRSLSYRKQSCSANQWTSFYMITVSVLKGLKRLLEKFKALLLYCSNHCFVSEGIIRKQQLKGFRRNDALQEPKITEL